MPDLALLLQTHIYLAILLGGLFEGETVVVLAGYAAHQGHASWWSVTLFAAAVNALVDQTWYLLGRWRGERVLERFPAVAEKVEKLRPRLLGHRRWLIFALRFSYGLRVAGPVALGIARVPLAEFLVLNLLAALVWASLFTGLGYVFGLALLNLLDEARQHEGRIALLILLAGGLGWLYVRRR
ncbi:MAG: VTT domain-containing protein [Azoarcus sp.]|jgi:membrane protein DedA with SNARE-associated domain|nr:VTT domain-containing protein [Azoarcus sp.]MDD2872837.1 VTT domain-containing protein [Azoarcus sp.]MDX9838759.1 VTT domain-containing protein [Azoarcus sp.]